MAGLPHVGNFRELVIYQKARLLAKDIFDVSATFPKDEMFSLTSQIRRSARSIGAQVAEAWGKRVYEKHFVSKLTDADGEQYETQHWIETAVDCGYLMQPKAHLLIQQCEEIGRLLNGMMAKSHLFCQQPSNTLREAPPEYFTNDPPDN